MRSLADYAAGVAEGWSEDTLARMFIHHDLPRAFHSLGLERQSRVLDNAPPLTGTPWDALLAAMAEHLAELHGHPTREWMDEPERFLDHTWVLARNVAIRANALRSARPRSYATEPSSIHATSTNGEENFVNWSPSRPLAKEDMHALFDALSEKLRRKRARAWTMTGQWPRRRNASMLGPVTSRPCAASCSAATPYRRISRQPTPRARIRCGRSASAAATAGVDVPAR